MMIITVSERAMMQTIDLNEVSENDVFRMLGEKRDQRKGLKELNDFLGINS